jgi:hypothetical protein
VLRSQHVLTQLTIPFPPTLPAPPAGGGAKAVQDAAPGAKPQKHKQGAEVRGRRTVLPSFLACCLPSPIHLPPFSPSFASHLRALTPAAPADIAFATLTLLCRRGKRRPSTTP